MIRVAGITPGTQVNGPGERVLLSLQGCTLACPGCFNPHTHSSTGGRAWTVKALAQKIWDLGGPIIDLTISGGEPMQQAAEVLELVTDLRGSFGSLGMFTGFYPEELAKIPEWEELKYYMSFAICGRYDRTQPNNTGLRSSKNQWLWLNGNRHYTLEHFLGGNDIEIHVQDGQQHITGFPSKELLEELCQLS